MADSVKRTLAYTMKMLRIMRGYTQQDIADKLHKTTNAVSNWELGNTSPPVDDLMELCKLYDVTPNQMYGWDECPELTDYIIQHEDAVIQIETLKRQKEEIENQIKAYTEIMNRKRP